MRTAIVTVEIPPFRENSPWLYGLEHFGDENMDLVGISDREQFGQGDFEGSTAHLLNVFVDPGTAWTRRELTEFSVKAYVYLSKLHRRKSYDRFVVVDCGGVEPLLVANLSVMASVYVVEPKDRLEDLEDRGGRLLELAARRFERDDLPNFSSASWPPEDDVIQEVFHDLTR